MRALGPRGEPSRLRTAGSMSWKDPQKAARVEGFERADYPDLADVFVQAGHPPPAQSLALATSCGIEQGARRRSKASFQRISNPQTLQLTLRLLDKRCRRRFHLLARIATLLARD